MERAIEGVARVWLVPHTHWDREWYATADDLRVRLARMLDEAIDALEGDDRLAFTLDGQSVLVEDYLSLRPAARDRLVALLATRRVVMGPMYAITDEHLVGAESLVRNFAVGCRQSRELGTEPMGLCYAPDTFAHVGQLPQLLVGFGLRAIVFTRGLGSDVDEHGSVLRWAGTDGSQVLGIQQPGGYSAAHLLGYLVEGADAAAADVPAIARNAAAQVRFVAAGAARAMRRSGVSQLLLSSGVDHGSLQRDLPDVLEAARGQLPGVELGITTYEGYLEAVEQELGDGGIDGLSLVHGELPGGADSHQLRDVASARIPLKQANERTERELHVAEVVAALAHHAGADSLASIGATPLAPGRARATNLRAELDWVWRELLKNHAHDSIWGSSTDEVHDDMEQRFRTARHVARRVIRVAVAMLGGEPERYDYQPLSATLPRLPVARASVAMLNPLGHARTAVVGMRVPDDLRGASALEAVVDGVARPVQLVREQRTATSRFAADSADPAYLRHVDLAQTPDDHEALVPIACAAFGTAQVTLRESSTEGARVEGAIARAAGARRIENGLVAIEVDDDGGVALCDLASGLELRDALQFVSVGDRGDEYTFDPVPGDDGWSSASTPCEVALAEAGPLRSTLRLRWVARLPHHLLPDRATRSSDLVDVPIVASLSLEAGSPRVRCTVQVDSRACDHRLRVRLAAGATVVEQVRAEAPFAIETRPARHAPVGGRWPVHLTTGSIAAGRLVVAGRGLHEYEVVDAPGGGSALELTLLRCVGWLSRNDLVRRPFGAGPSYPTPDAQCPGEHHAEFVVSLPSEPPSDADLLRFSQDAAVDFVECAADVVTAPPLDGGPGDDLVVTMVKQADDGQGVVLRAVHAGTEPAALAVDALPDGVRRCRMDEQELATGGDAVGVRPHEIVTLRIG